MKGRAAAENETSSFRYPFRHNIFLTKSHHLLHPEVIPPPALPSGHKKIRSDEGVKPWQGLTVYFLVNSALIPAQPFENRDVPKPFQEGTIGVFGMEDRHPFQGVEIA